MTRRRPSPTRANHDAIQLTRWQVTGALLGVLVLTVLVFFVGVGVGASSNGRMAPELARIVAAPSAAAAVVSPEQLRDRRERSAALADVHPGTATIDHDLSRPVERVVPRDPTDAARIETHIQLARSRAFGVAGVEGGAPAMGDSDIEPAAVVVPGAVDRVEGRGEARWSLQVSAFDSKAAADAIAGQLTQDGHAARVREVSASGRRFYRVEVGDFADQQAALSYKSAFERDSGYSTAVVPNQ